MTTAMRLPLIMVTRVHRHDTSVECRVTEIGGRAEGRIQKNLNFRLFGASTSPHCSDQRISQECRSFTSSFRDGAPPSSSGPSCSDWRLNAEICLDGRASVLSPA